MKITKKHSEWIREYWRPMMAMTYMAIIIFDFIIGPIFWTIAQIVGGGSVIVQWSPLTLIGGGIFHAAMGAVLGISAWTRGQEKVEQVRRDFEDDIVEDQDAEQSRHRRARSER